MASQAVLRNVRLSPRKTRLVANLIRGRDVSEAVEMLTFSQKKAGGIIKKLIESAVANAEHVAETRSESIDVDSLFVDTIMVDAGPTLRRFRPRAQGRATPILKKTSHITVILGTR
jgi:large subunit ribosomal protein L22